MLVLGIVCFLAGIFLFITDLSARRNTRRAQQAALQRENEYLTTRIHTIESQFPQALIVVDARGLIRRVNPAAEELFGYAEDELLGNNILRLLPSAPPARNPQAPQIALDGMQGAQVEVRRNDKSVVKVRMTRARPQYLGPSDLYMFFAAVVPQPEPAMVLLERVVGRITAKFEELLTTINGYGELALHAAGEDSQLRQHLEEIVTASEQASHLTRNLLAFSGNQLIPVEPLDLNTVVHVAAHDIPEAELDLAPEPAVALANGECLQQVVRLLAEGARARGSGAAGKTRIQTASYTLDRPRAVYSGELSAGSYTVIRVADSRTTLTAEALAHLFEPLHPDSDLHRVDLSPIYGIVASLSGRLHVESNRTAGTTFEIWLPALPSRSLADGPLPRGAVASG